MGRVGNQNNAKQLIKRWQSSKSQAEFEPRNLDVLWPPTGAFKSSLAYVFVHRLVLAAFVIKRRCVVKQHSDADVSARWSPWNGEHNGVSHWR